MIVTCIHVHVKPDMIDHFINETTANHNKSVREAGNLRFDLIQQVDDPSWFMLYEAYETEEASVKHKSTPHYLKWRDAVADFMAEPRKGIKYTIIEPSDKTRW